MSPKLKRALNAFALGALASAVALVMAKKGEFNDAIAVGDWGQLRFLIVPVLAGSLAGGFRALQSNIPFIPSPEPEENPPKVNPKNRL